MSSTFGNLHWISCNFIFGKRKTSQVVKSGSWLGAIGSPCCYTEKLTCYESSVRGCIIQLVIDRTTKTPTDIEENDVRALGQAADLSGIVGLLQRLFGIRVISVAQVVSPVMNLDMKFGSCMLH